MASVLPEPLRMILTNPAILDLSSNGPLPYAARQRLTGHPPPLPPDLSLAGKSVLVTGATAGVGLEAARQVASLKPRALYIGARNLPKAEEVKSQLERDNVGLRVTVLELDQESLALVDTLVQTLSQHEARLDVALLNAGGLVRESRLTVDGYSPTLQVNFLSTAYLALRLLPLLYPAQQPPDITSNHSTSRLVLVGSEGHAWSTYPETATEPSPLASCRHLPGPNSGSLEEHYYRSKLFLSLIARELAQRVDRTRLTVVITTPGFCASDFFLDSAGVVTRVLKRIAARSVQQGGGLHVHAVTASAESAHGAYLRDGRPARLSPFAEGPGGQALQPVLWDELQALLLERGYRSDV